VRQEQTASSSARRSAKWVGGVRCDPDPPGRLPAGQLPPGHPTAGELGARRDQGAPGRSPWRYGSCVLAGRTSVITSMWTVSTILARVPWTKRTKES